MLRSCLCVHACAQSLARCAADGCINLNLTLRAVHAAPPAGLFGMRSRPSFLRAAASGGALHSTRSRHALGPLSGRLLSTTAAPGGALHSAGLRQVLGLHDGKFAAAMGALDSARFRQALILLRGRFEACALSLPPPHPLLDRPKVPQPLVCGDASRGLQKALQPIL